VPWSSILDSTKEARVINDLSMLSLDAYDESKSSGVSYSDLIVI